MLRLGAHQCQRLISSGSMQKGDAVVRQPKTEDARKMLIDLAFTWTQAASLSERKSVGPLKGLTLA